ncbi:ATP-binding protein [Desulfovibrio legallii]|mgnify:FL=1|uniref:4Fe-4S dicluster domain-containing protein n=1 Tax=Desulfovibrio legallii TaxID=571438 RepID=A0A6H3F6J0_9BACT|nr:ATP-binding protein [Desulfovibrio legallii]RHH24940.1 4Fe-4S dicluster domain-containing protein [Desulfovibrio sp. AM18-2]TBH80832.1 4Fe-4S dicluster domain-containing protein [Desulfovibrio legallii]
MPEIVVVSGKGGTGKTSLCAAFAALAHAERLGLALTDLDVDVPDLHILLDPRRISEEPFISGNTAVVDPARCTGCGQCVALCRFEAINLETGVAKVDPLACEGCGVCYSLCPDKAIAFPERHCGQWYVSETRLGPFVHAQLAPGAENSGRLVALLKTRTRELAAQRGLDWLLCDGSPGVGCPVISSLSGADLAVAVVEPTPAGKHDFTRVAELCAHFRIPVAVCINKADLNPEEATAIRTLAAQNGHTVVGELPFSPLVPQAMLRRRALTEDPSPLTAPLAAMWRGIRQLAATPRKPAAALTHL